MKNIILTLLMGLLLVGCVSINQDPNSTTELREYTINSGDFVVVGIGHFDADGKTFLIQSFDGQDWEIPPNAKIEEDRVTLESFRKVTP